MEKILWELVEEVGGRLRSEELFARCLTVKIRYANFQTLTRSRTLPCSDLLRQRNLRNRKRSVRAKCQSGQGSTATWRKRQCAAKFRLAGTALKS